VLALAPWLRLAGPRWPDLAARWSGLPLLGAVRAAELSWLVALGLAAAAGGAFAWLARERRHGLALAAAVCALAIAEWWPRAAAVEAPPSPRFLADLALDPEPWTVVDLSRDTRRRWNQLLHRHALVAPDELGGSEPRGRGVQHPELGALLGRAAAGVPALQDRRVRFVIAEEGSRGPLRADLRVAYRGDGLLVVEIPPRSTPIGLALPR
jgi:hypothetical protein